MKKLFIVLALVLCLTGCNAQVIDTTYKFDYAYVELPNGEEVEGKVDSWKDYEDCDQIQVKINGVTYFTNSTRVVLIAK